MISDHAYKFGLAESILACESKTTGLTEPIIKACYQHLSSQGYINELLTIIVKMHVNTRAAAGVYSIIFISPELLLTDKHWIQLFSNKDFKECLMGLVVDEAYCIKNGMQMHYCHTQCIL